MSSMEPGHAAGFFVYSERVTAMKKQILVGVMAATLLSSGMTCYASALSSTMTPEDYTRYIMATPSCDMQYDAELVTSFSVSNGTDTYVVSGSSNATYAADTDARHKYEVSSLDINGVPSSSGTEESYTDYSTGYDIPWKMASGRRHILEQLL